MSITWTKGPDGLQRGFARRPGYDCRTACEHADKGDHGWHGDEWDFIVRQDGVALCLTVYTGYFADRPALEAEWRLTALHRAMGAFLTLHRRQDFSLSGPGRIRHHTDAQPGALSEVMAFDCPALCAACPCVEGPCRAETLSLLWADEVFRAHGNPAAPEQPEALWQELARRLRLQLGEQS
jgi:hypothetical protein